MDLNNEIKVKISAALEVDDATVNMCMQLITIHAKNHGLKGLILRFHENDNDPSMMPLMTKEDVEKRMYPKIHEED